MRIVPVKIILLIAILGLSACSQKDQSEILVIDIAGNINNTQDLKLSDIADEITYIPLETGSECLLSQGHTIEVTKDYFFISDKDKPLFVFDREGKFVRKIGAIGNGPGEFHDCSQFHLDEQKREVYILNQNKEFMRYSWDGDYLGTTELPYTAIYYYKLSNDEYYFYNNTQRTRNSVHFRMYFTDSQFNFSGAFEEDKKEMTLPVLVVGVRMWGHSEEKFAQLEFSDTIYQIQKNKLSPRYFFDFGKIRMKPEMLLDFELFVENMEEYVIFYDVSTIDRIWTINFTQKGETFLGIIDPDKQKVQFATEIDTSMNGLINNIDGGPGFFPVRTMQSSQWQIAIPAFEFISWNEAGLFDKPDIYNPEANEKLKKMANGLNENDNPVLMLVKKKSKLDFKIFD